MPDTEREPSLLRCDDTTPRDRQNLKCLPLAFKIARLFGQTIEEVFTYDEDDG